MVLFLCLMLALVAGYAYWLQQQGQSLDQQLQASVAARAALERELSKYRPIMDVEAYARRNREEADAYAARTRAQTDQEVASLLRSTAEHERKAQEALGEAQQQGAAVIAMASRRAQQIAGEALEAKANAAKVADTVQAMRNIIDGYGDLYLVPTPDLLDELAQEVGFSEPGKRLKEARDKVRMLIKTRNAAACNDKNPNRSLLAIHFVLDAFNGKADSILSDVRHDNFGTLRQKLIDAATLMNKNGEAFEHARILPQFLDARIDELKWAVAVHELKQREREEQRAFREQLRDEERAQKEYERAQKEAAKEEETLRAAMEKVQREVARATDEQRAKYEEQLAQLNVKLLEAEAKNQRALSMAQQTKAGTVYVISNVGSFGESVFKIGMTRRLQAQERVDELGDASVPFPFDVHAFITTQDAPALEKALHRRFCEQQVNRVNPRKEFFRASVMEIKEAVEAMGLGAVEWTLAAACREYRESLVASAATTASRSQVHEANQRTHADATRGAGGLL